MSELVSHAAGRHRAKPEAPFEFRPAILASASASADRAPLALDIARAAGIAAAAIGAMLLFGLLITASPGCALALVAFGVPAFVLWARSRPAAVQAREEARIAALEAQRPLVERNYRMEVKLGWRPDTGYDLATEAARFSEVGILGGVPRPAIWSYSDALGGVPLRTPGGAVGPLNRRYGPWTPVQWAGVAAGAFTLMHHRRR